MHPCQPGLLPQHLPHPGDQAAGPPRQRAGPLQVGAERTHLNLSASFMHNPRECLLNLSICILLLLLLLLLCKLCPFRPERKRVKAGIGVERGAKNFLAVCIPRGPSPTPRTFKLPTKMGSERGKGGGNAFSLHYLHCW